MLYEVNGVFFPERTKKNDKENYKSSILLSETKCMTNENMLQCVRFEVFTAVTIKDVVFWGMPLYSSCVNRRFGRRYRLHLQSRKSTSGGTSVSKWLQTEPPVGNNQIYKNRERRRLGHNGKSRERRGVWSLLKVKPAGSRGRSISGRGSVGGGKKSRATERKLTQ
jgi:hypothetical protein